MNGHINPYYRQQGLMSLKISSFISADVDFKYMFYGDQMNCQNEPMFKWLVDTRKVLTVNTADKDWALIKNKRREKSWISEEFSYWSSPSRYFIIGYAIETCKGSGSSLSVSLDDIADLFSNRDRHQQLIDNFVKDFFHDASIDIYSAKACKNSSLIEYKTLKSCFENGYRLCSDLYLALDQAKKMGPVGSYMRLSNVCTVLGFDELPIWYIQESSDHYLNAEINNDINAQKTRAVWAFLRSGDESVMIAQNDPYGVRDDKGYQGPTRQVNTVSLGGAINTNKSKASTKKDTRKNSAHVDKVKEKIAFESKGLDINTETSDDFDVPDSLGLDTDDESVALIEPQLDTTKAQDETPRASKKADRLLTMFQ